MRPDQVRLRPRPVAVTDDWFFWRRQHPRIFVARTGEDGEQHHWMALLNELGSAKLSAAVHAVAKTIQKESRVTLAAVLQHVDATKPAPTHRAPDHWVETHLWRDRSWCSIADLLCNPAKYCETRLHTNDPERVAKAVALAEEIRAWFPKLTNKIAIADAVMQSDHHRSLLVERRFLTQPPTKATRPASGATTNSPSPPSSAPSAFSLSGALEPSP